MAKPEHLEILKSGVSAWNQWREENPRIKPRLNGEDLRNSHLSYADLSSVNLCGANLRGSKLIGINLDFARLNGAYLSDAVINRASLIRAKLTGTFFINSKLVGADLSHASLKKAKLIGADLSHANLKGTDLSYADLNGATFWKAILDRTNLAGSALCHADLGQSRLEKVDLTDADLSNAKLSGATLFLINLKGAQLKGTKFKHAHIEGVNFTDVNLGEVDGLATVTHGGPSEISTSTIYSSQGKIPDIFLRGCGLNDWQIETAKLYQPDLSNEEITNILYKIHDQRASQAIQINPLFISYSHTDDSFVNKMEEYLIGRGVRFWRDTHHATAGRLERQIDRAIRFNPTVLLILSEHSTQSDWVQHEVRLARKLEIETKRDVLCPIALDDSWKDCNWPERLREQVMEYNILDFSEWRDENKFRRMFNRLLDGLGLFYK